MEVTTKFMLLKRKKDEDGTIPVYMSLCENRRRLYISTGIAVSERDWNSRSQQVRKSHSNYALYNQVLTDLHNKAELELIRLKHSGILSADALKDVLQCSQAPKDDPTRHESATVNLIDYSWQYVEWLKSEKRFWDARHYGVVVRNMEAFQNGREIAITGFDADMLQKFQRYLLHKVGNSPNTTRKKLQRFRAIIKRALKDKLIDKDPYLLYDPVKKESTGKARLTFDQIKAMEGLMLPSGSDLWHARNYFLFSFYCAGIRFGDLCCLKWENIVDERLIYRMNKTRTVKNIKLLKAAVDLLKCYKERVEGHEFLIFPMLDLDPEASDPMALRQQISSRNVVVNRNLKTIAKMAGIEEKVSFHVSRHSFANYARKKGMSIYDISKALGHSSIRVTEDVPGLL